MVHGLETLKRLNDEASAEKSQVDDVEDFFNEISSLFDKHQDHILELINEARTVRATLVVNFGREHGRKVCGLEIEEKLPTHKMLIAVLDEMLAKAEPKPSDKPWYTPYSVDKIKEELVGDDNKVRSVILVKHLNLAFEKGRQVGRGEVSHGE